MTQQESLNLIAATKEAIGYTESTPQTCDNCFYSKVSSSGIRCHINNLQSFSVKEFARCDKFKPME